MPNSSHEQSTTIEQTLKQFGRRLLPAAVVASAIAACGGSTKKQSSTTNKSPNPPARTTNAPEVVNSRADAACPENHIDFNKKVPAAKKQKAFNLLNNRMNLVAYYAGDNFIQILEGQVGLSKGTTIHYEPTNFPRYKDLKSLSYKLSRPLEVDNPILTTDANDTDWLLVNAPKGAGFVKLGDSNDTWYERLPRSMTLTSGGKTHELTHAGDISAYEAPVMSTGISFGYSSGELVFNGRGFTFDEVIGFNKQELLKDAERAKLLQIGQVACN